MRGDGGRQNEPGGIGSERLKCCSNGLRVEMKTLPLPYVIEGAKHAIWGGRPFGDAFIDMPVRTRLHGIWLRGISGEPQPCLRSTFGWDALFDDFDLRPDSRDRGVGEERCA